MVTRTMEEIIPAEGIFLSIIHGESGDVITNDFTPFEGLSNEEIIDLIEMDNRLYKLEVKKRKARRKYKENNRIKIAMINIIRAL